MSIAKPFTFTPNTYAKSSEVNQDFDILYSQVNTNISSIAQNATDIDSLENNKANINGNSTQRFAVANPTISTDAVNKGYLEGDFLTGDYTFTGDNTFSGDITFSGDVSMSGDGSKLFDGQWVTSSAKLSTSANVGTYTLDFSSYLPDDDYSYEVQIHLRANLGSSYNTTVSIGGNEFFAGDGIGSGTIVLSANGLVIIDSTRNSTMQITNHNASSMTVTANMYRRIGTNS